MHTLACMYAQTHQQRAHMSIRFKPYVPYSWHQIRKLRGKQVLDMTLKAIMFFVCWIC